MTETERLQEALRLGKEAVDIGLNHIGVIPRNSYQARQRLEEIEDLIYALRKE